jgi:hypothetical protein
MNQQNSQIANDPLILGWIHAVLALFTSICFYHSRSSSSLTAVSSALILLNQITAS